MRWLVFNSDKWFCFPPSPLSVPKLSKKTQAATQAIKLLRQKPLGSLFFAKMIHHSDTQKDWSYYNFNFLQTKRNFITTTFTTHTGLPVSCTKLSKTCVPLWRWEKGLGEFLCKAVTTKQFRVETGHLGQARLPVRFPYLLYTLTIYY